MKLRPLNTKDGSASYRKVLLYGHHGWGKTTQFKHYLAEYGPGLIISGESGLGSIASAGIDYLPFSSWDGTVDEAKGLYSFRSIFDWTRTADFAARGYKWIGIDSLTELSDMSLRHAEATAKAVAERTGKKVDGFAVWGDHAAQLLGACKAVRDMNMHVLVTALAKESTDENNASDYWPMVAGKAVMQQLPGIFDCVFCCVRSIREVEEDGKMKKKVVRFVVTDEVQGWHGKVRDEHRRLKPIEESGNIVELFKKMEE